METKSVCATLISENFHTSDYLKPLYMNPLQYMCDPLKYMSLNELGHFMSESLCIEDGSKLSPNTVFCQTFDVSDNLDLNSDGNCKNFVEIDTTKVNAQELPKSATCPYSGETQLTNISTYGKSEECANYTAAKMKQASCEFTKTAYPQSISVPLVSAMKGTRDKLGTPRDKLRVTWAPDVYDPPPSASSTAVINNKHRRKSDRKKNIDTKKNGKNKQKKKSSKGSSSSKDKKAVQKYYRGNNVFYPPWEGERKLVVEGFDCGSTFLKASSVTKMHFSVAEAT